MITVEDARGRILSAIQPLTAEKISLSNALGRYLAEPLHSLADLPPADNSAMDGYAVRAADLAPASIEKPVALQLNGESRAGRADPGAIEPGTCIRIFTGAPLPHGADAVVMQEDVQREEGPTVNIIFHEPIKPWENIRLRGEDIRHNARLAEVGDKLTAQRLALLAGGGIAQALVALRPLVGLLATGDELREPGQPLEKGMIYDSNRAGLAALVRQAGGNPKTFPAVADDLQTTRRALQTAFQECDVVVTSGGVSVGVLDYVKQAFTEIGGTLDFWTVSMRPGKPFAFGSREGKFLFGLPGNPVSAMVTFFILTRPALLKMQGARDTAAPVSWGRLAEPLNNRGDRRHFARVIVDAEGHVRTAGSQASHMLSSMAPANGLVDILPGAEWPAGALVPVLRWD